jgi:hypothetical protein
MASHQEEEVLGKAYDSRLMRRLLRYLSPYKVKVFIALASIILKAGADVLGPFLTMVATWLRQNNRPRGQAISSARAHSPVLRKLPHSTWD